MSEKGVSVTGGTYIKSWCRSNCSPMWRSGEHFATKTEMRYHSISYWWNKQATQTRYLKTITGVLKPSYICKGISCGLGENPKKLLCCWLWVAHLCVQSSTCQSQQGRLVMWVSVCDGTQNVKRYRYWYFFSDTKYFWYRSRYFFCYQIFPILVPRLFSRY